MNTVKTTKERKKCGLGTKSSRNDSLTRLKNQDGGGKSDLQWEFIP